MPFLKTLLIRLCLFWLPLATILAAPVHEINHGNITRHPGGDTTRHNEMDLAKISQRDLGDRNNPYDASFDITNWPNIAEEDCFAMLCLLNGNRVYQRVATANGGDVNYQRSGASLREFRQDQLQTRHTAQINAETTSAEEFPWESMQEGGANAYVFPATPGEQQYQGGAISRGYLVNRVPYGKFFKVTFEPADSFGVYCTALHSDPPDFSVCQNNNLKQRLWGIGNVILANFVYQVNRNTKPFVFTHAAGSKVGT